MEQCPVCGEKSAAELIGRRDGYTLKRCPACDVVFSDPMKSPGASWYENSEMYAVGKVFHASIGWNHREFINDPQMYGRRLLDVGCGPGAFLNEARKKGYEVWGLDFDSGNIKTAKELYGLENVSVKSVEELLSEKGVERFDVVTLFEVIEHLEDPAAFIRQVKGILKPGGHIVLSAPNRERVFDPLGEADDPPNHLTKWNRASLCAFLERNGFEVVRLSVKRLDADEAVGVLKTKIRFGISKGIARRGIDSQNNDDIKKAAMLLKIKDSAFRCARIFFMPVLSLISLQGSGLYALARVKK